MGPAPPPDSPLTTPSRPLILPRKEDQSLPTGNEPPPDVRNRIMDDPWARTLGVTFLELRPGYCRVALELGPQMLNFQGHPHGGVIFSLADIAFGAACNAHGRAAVALTTTISYLAPAPPGTRLVAEARVRRQGRRAGFYEVVVTDDAGTLVATLHCISHRVDRYSSFTATPDARGRTESC